jgi:hypothetical protein
MTISREIRFAEKHLRRLQSNSFRSRYSQAIGFRIGGENMDYAFCQRPKPKMIDLIEIHEVISKTEICQQSSLEFFQAEAPHI